MHSHRTLHETKKTGICQKIEGLLLMENMHPPWVPFGPATSTLLETPSHYSVECPEKSESLFNFV